MDIIIRHHCYWTDSPDRMVWDTPGAVLCVSVASYDASEDNWYLRVIRNLMLAGF